MFQHDLCGRRCSFSIRSQFCQFVNIFKEYIIVCEFADANQSVDFILSAIWKFLGRPRNFHMALSMKSTDWLASANSHTIIYSLKMLTNWQNWERIEKLHLRPQRSC